MQITREMKLRALWLLCIRAPGHWLAALLHMFGIGAYRPYAANEAPRGEWVECIALIPPQVFIIMGSGDRSHMPVSMPGGECAYVQLNNDARVNSLTFMTCYRFKDGTRCGRYILFATQADVDKLALYKAKRMGYA